MTTIERRWEIEKTMHRLSKLFWTEPARLECNGKAWSCNWLCNWAGDLKAKELYFKLSDFSRKRYGRSL